MATGVNKVILVGNLGTEPEIKHLDSGMALARLRIATSESFKDREGNRQERTEWHTVILWNRLAEIAEQYLTKGSQIYIEGSLRTRSYEQDGVTKYTTEIVGNTMTMLGGSRKNSSPEATQTKMENNSSHENTAPEANNNVAPEDDLPF